MNFMDKTNKLLKRLRRKTDEWSRKSGQRVEQSRIESAAQGFIKDKDFSSEAEKQIMLKAADKERERKDKLAARLKADPILAKFYFESIADISSFTPPPETIRSIRIREEGAMKAAVSKRDFEERLEREGPEVRNIFNNILPEIEEQIRKYDSSER